MNSLIKLFFQFSIGLEWFIRINEFHITANQKALNFLEKNNFKFWKLEKPLKIVNDKDLKEEYYLIEFPENDNLLSEESKKEWKKFIDSNGAIDVPDKYFKNKRNRIGIFSIPQFGPYFCNSQTKSLLENSGLTGFEFEEQKLASEKLK